MSGPGLTQSLQQRMQLTMVPQLRQSLEILQVPALELRSLIQQEMESNPTLEEVPEEVSPRELEGVEAEDRDTEPAAATGDGDDPPERDVERDGPDSDGEAATEKAETDADADAQVDMLVGLDDEWRDHLPKTQSSYSREDAERHQFALDSISQPISLQQHLMNQIALADLQADEIRLAELIIGSLDDDGYLTTTIDDLAASTGEDLNKLRDILEIIKDFDPIGVGAANLSECLWLQLKRLGRGDSMAAQIVLHHLDRLAGHKYNEISNQLEIPLEQIEKEARLISTLEPKPGRRFASDNTTYVVPEITVLRNDEGEYVIVLNNDYIPHLHVSDHYRSLMHDQDTATDVKKYIREKVRSSLFLIKSINQRQQTIQKIATEIVRIQKEFLDNGVTHLRPLTMAEVAGIVGVHETTVSRAIAGKYMLTPRGTFEMKYFFTPGFKNADGQSVSNQTIKDAIQTLINEENPDSPLSDQSIVTLLKDRGFNVARRTIAKYREELKILPSHLRKGFGTSK